MAKKKAKAKDRNKKMAAYMKQRRAWEKAVKNGEIDKSVDFKAYRLALKAKKSSGNDNPSSKLNAALVAEAVSDNELINELQGLIDRIKGNTKSNAELLQALRKMKG